MAKLPHEQRRFVKIKLYKPTDKWTEIIEKELANMGKEYQQLYELRFVRRLNENKICNTLHIERTTYYKYVRDIIENVWSAARENKLFDIRKK